MRNKSFEQKYVIGVVGGLGPFAHIAFEKRLLDAAIRIVGASDDQDFPRWILSSIPQTPDRTLAICGNGPTPVPKLVESLKRLETLYDRNGEKVPGADFAVIVCNTAHQFLGEAQKRVSMPLLDMVEETSIKIARRYPGARTGILATTGTLECRIYHKSLERHGLIPQSLLDITDGEAIQRRLVMETIYGEWDGNKFAGGGLKSGRLDNKYANNFKKAAGLLIDSLNADLFIAGCTEIPIALPGSEICGKSLADPMMIAAEKAVSVAYGLAPGFLP